MVSFQKLENGVEEDLKIHFDSTLKVKKKHTGKSENLTVGGKRAFFFQLEKTLIKSTDNEICETRYKGHGGCKEAIQEKMTASLGLIR